MKRVSINLGIVAVLSLRLISALATIASAQKTKAKTSISGETIRVTAIEAAS